MLIFLCGTDSYRRQQKLSEIVANYQSKFSGFSVGNFDLTDKNQIIDLKNFCSQESLFSPKKLAVIKNAFFLKDVEIKEILLLAENYFKYENTILIFDDTEDPAKEFKKYLKAPSLVQEFESLTQDKNIIFINQETKKRDLKISKDGILFLNKFFKDDNWGIINTLDQLLELYGKRTISQIEISSFIYSMPEAKLFSYIDSVLKNKNVKQKLLDLEILLLNQEDPAKIFNILASRPMVSGELLEKLADYDVSIKSGKMDYDTALLDLSLT